MPRPKKSNRSDGRYELKKTIGHDANGNPIRKSFYGKNKDEAQIMYEQFRRGEEIREAEKKNLLFSAWVDRWLETYKRGDVKETTFLTTYKRPCYNYIIPYFEERSLQSITPIDLKQFLNSITNLSQSYIDKIVICLRGIFDSAEDNDLIVKNPARHISCKSKQEPTGKRVYDRETVEALCNADHKYTLYIAILLKMGLRCSELCGLRWKDIDFENGFMCVNQALTREAGVTYIDSTKSKTSTRRIPVPKTLLSRLEEQHSQSNDEYVAMINGHHMTPDHFNERQMESFYNYLNVPSCERLTAHELRHTCGTLLYEDTKDIYYVSKFLGHSDIGITTKTYVHSEFQEKKIHVNFG
jgi:integrase